MQHELLVLHKRLEGGLRLACKAKDTSPSRPLISIITATFNASEFLPRTIKSIRGLAYDNIEWIVVDGESQDTTVDLIRQCEDVIDYWVSEPDNGIYDAWNKGVSLARGDWIAFLGAGDCYMPDALNAYVNAIIQSAVAPDLVSSRVQFVNDGGMVKRVKGAPFKWDTFKKHMTIAHVGALHHKSLFQKYGLFDTTYSSSGDYEFFMRCGADLKTLYLDDITANMLVGGVSDGYKGITETYYIQRKYKVGISAKCRYWLACAKRLVRPWLRGY